MKKESTVNQIGSLFGFNSIEEDGEKNSTPIDDPNDLKETWEIDAYQALHGYPEKKPPFDDIIDGKMTLDEKAIEIFTKCKIYIKLSSDEKLKYKASEGDVYWFHNLLGRAKTALEKEANGKVYARSFLEKMKKAPEQKYLTCKTNMLNVGIDYDIPCKQNLVC